MNARSQTDSQLAGDDREKRPSSKKEAVSSAVLAEFNKPVWVAATIT